MPWGRPEGLGEGALGALRPVAWEELLSMFRNGRGAWGAEPCHELAQLAGAVAVVCGLPLSREVW